MNKPLLTPAQTQARATFLQQMNDGRLDKSVAEGSGLPNTAYTCADFYALEQQTVFRSNWVFAGFAHRLQSVGDMLPVEVAGQPVVLVRDKQQTVRAFHNVCRHRGALIVKEAKNGRKFVCPNHAWTYGLDGRLIARPHFYGGEKHDINNTACPGADMRPIACHTWHDWIFVNISGDAGSFDQWVQPLGDRLEGYDFGDLQFSTALEFDVKVNWKLAVENFIEPYHVFSCHPWLNDFAGMDERQAPEFDDHLLYCGYQFKAPDPTRAGLLPWFNNLPEDKHNRGEWFVLFPNFALEIFPDQVDVFIATPTGATSCHETIALYLVGEGAQHEKYAEARKLLIKNWHDLNQEDIAILERMQAGRYSEGFEGGVLSPYWDPVQQHYARLVTNAISRLDLN